METAIPTGTYVPRSLLECFTLAMTRIWRCRPIVRRWTAYARPARALPPRSRHVEGRATSSPFSKICYSSTSEEKKHHAA